MAVIKSGASSNQWTIDGTSLAGRTTNYDTAGRDLSINSKVTYSATSASFSAAATPTDVFIINGSASKTIRIVSMRFNSLVGTALVKAVSLIKRSTANSGGTAVTTTIVPHDSNNSAATAVAQHYTANATLGNTVGTVNNVQLFFPAAATATSNAPILELLPIDLTTGLPQPIVLRGTGEGLAINLNSSAATHTVCFAGVTWTEE